LQDATKHWQSPAFQATNKQFSPLHKSEIKFIHRPKKETKFHYTVYCANSIKQMRCL